MAQPPNCQARNGATLTDHVWTAHDRRAMAESMGSVHWSYRIGSGHHSCPLLEKWINTFDLPATQKKRFLEKQTHSSNKIRGKCEDN